MMHPVVLLDAISDVLVIVLVGLAVYDDRGRRSVGYLAYSVGLNVYGVDVVVIVRVNQGENVSRLLVLEISSLGPLAGLYAINVNGSTVGIQRQLGVVYLDLGSIGINISLVYSVCSVVRGRVYAQNGVSLAVLEQNLNALTQQVGVILGNLGKLGFVVASVVNSIAVSSNYAS